MAFYVLLLATLFSCKTSIYSHGISRNNSTGSSFIDLFALSAPPDDDISEANQETVAMKYAFMDRRIMMMNSSMQSRDDLLCVSFITLMSSDDSSLPTSGESSSLTILIT